MSHNQLYYCPNAVVPEIPEIVDVLVLLRCLPEEDQKNLEFCASNHYTYVRNYIMVAAAVADKIHEVIYDYPGASFIEQAEKIVAKSIVDLTPKDDDLSFNHAYRTACDKAIEEGEE